MAIESLESHDETLPVLGFNLEQIISSLPLHIYNSVLKGMVDPCEVGLVRPKTRLFDGIEEATIAQPRVAEWHPDHFILGDLIKLKTMHETTPEGDKLEESLIELANLGLVELTPKQIKAWRICRPLARRMSLDELPQLVCNVLGIGEDVFPNLLKMKFIGSARPVLPEEILFKGDNTNDEFGRGLERFAKLKGDSRWDTYVASGHKYDPGLITPATAGGYRQLGTEESFFQLLVGIDKHYEMMKLPPAQRIAARGQMVISTLVHVVRQTDAV